MLWPRSYRAGATWSRGTIVPTRCSSSTVAWWCQRKRPGDELDYQLDFARWLSEGDTITGAVVTIASTAGGTASIDHTDFSQTQVTVWVQGGVNGETATLTVTATTAQGRTKVEKARLRIKDS
jgi:hypothetical protein